MRHLLGPALGASRHLCSTCLPHSGGLTGLPIRLVMEPWLRPSNQRQCPWYEVGG